MIDSPVAARALSFGAVADTYDRYRPAPPGEAVDWVLPTSAVDVLDLGAGTSAVTRLLRERLARWHGPRTQLLETPGRRRR
jgi:trans-aconitate methyltransferase